MSRIENNIEIFDREDFFLIAASNAPVAVNHVKNEKTLGHMHRHDFHELTTVLDGSGKYEYQGITYELNPGDTFITPAGEKHHYCAQQQLSLMNFIWYPERLPVQQDSLKHIPGYRAFFDLEPQSRSLLGFEHRLVLMPEQTSTIQMFFRRIEKELQKKADGFMLSAGLIFIELMITVSRFYSEQKNTRSHNDNDLQKLGNVLAFLDANYMNNISRRKAAKIHGSSETTFSRSFKRIMSESFFDYLLNLRLQHARKTLMESNKTISEIAAECGFCDSNYLCYRFRLKFGVPPHQFRLNCRKENI